MITPLDSRKRFRTTFALSWGAYASYYLGRKGFSVVKSQVGDQLSLSADALGLIDTAYLALYAVGQFISGWLGDRVGARKLLGYGMILSALACVSFGLGRLSIVLTVSFAINGLAQSSGWPGCNKAMATVTAPAERGGVMGVWSTCYQVGGLVATALSTWLLAHFGWRQAFIVPAVWLLGYGILILATLPEPTTETHIPAGERQQNHAAPMRSIYRSPVLWSYGASYFAIKLIRYSLLFWLPYYLHHALGYAEETSGYLSTAFEIGGIAGAIGIGFVSDRLKNVPRALLAAVSLLLLALSLVLYLKIAHVSLVANFAAMALVGVLLFGPDSLLSATAAQDLGGDDAAGAAVGFVNGIGSVGAILQGLVTVQISKRYGWTALFWVFVGLAVVAAVALAPAIRHRRPQADS